MDTIRHISITTINAADSFSFDDARRKTEGRLDTAIGYLSTWAIGSEVYRHVYITLDLKSLELVATFRRLPRTSAASGGGNSLYGWCMERRREKVFVPHVEARTAPQGAVLAF